MISNYSSPDSSLFLLVLVATLGIILFIILIVVVSLAIAGSRRKNVFHKLSNEYGLRVETQKSSSSSAVFLPKLYPLLRMVGTVRGHTVCIEDLRSVPFGGALGLVLLFLAIGRGGPMVSFSTEITVDNLKHIINNVSILYASGRHARYQQIKIVLDGLV